jgi:O-antigen/teichoic acid export membrane protein
VLSELYQSDKQGFLSTSNRLLMVSILFGLPMGVLGTVFAKEAIKFLVGTQYAASVIIFQIMVWLAPLHFVRNAYRTSLLAAGLQRPQNWGLFLGLVGVALTGLIFIPVNGVIGAVVSLMIAEAIILVSMMLIYIYALKRRCQTVLVGE